MSAKDKPVSMPSNDAYREGHDRIYGKKVEDKPLAWPLPRPHMLRKRATLTGGGQMRPTAGTRMGDCYDWVVSKVQKDSGTKGKCWMWKGAWESNGYGQVKMTPLIKEATGAKTSKQLMHRLMYELCVGSIPEGRLVMHSCDTPACVNPDHLLVGTDGHNGQDSVNKGRRRGRKLDLTKAGEILWLADNGWTNSRIAERYDLTPMYVSKVINGINWGMAKPVRPDGL